MLINVPLDSGWRLLERDRGEPLSKALARLRATVNKANKSKLGKPKKKKLKQKGEANPKDDTEPPPEPEFRSVRPSDIP
eukprot:119393-Pyramimonas_sp.AAC.1